jgi:hypothetical protein
MNDNQNQNSEVNVNRQVGIIGQELYGKWHCASAATSVV